ncbi:hypothetical protein GCM10009788_58040 [Nocardioides humi]|uniref:ATP-grasp target RiPP n=1 Tax=Nocardioides humi TaxID=449461 RepID=A0ABN2BX01_9ACTN
MSAGQPRQSRASTDSARDTLIEYHTRSADTLVRSTSHDLDLCPSGTLSELTTETPRDGCLAVRDESVTSTYSSGEMK